jgi:hypothetical protein
MRLGSRLAPHAGCCPDSERVPAGGPKLQLLARGVGEAKRAVPALRAAERCAGGRPSPSRTPQRPLDAHTLIDAALPLHRVRHDTDAQRRVVPLANGQVAARQDMRMILFVSLVVAERRVHRGLCQVFVRSSFPSCSKRWDDGAPYGTGTTPSLDVAYRGAGPCSRAVPLDLVSPYFAT